MLRLFLSSLMRPRHSRHVVSLRTNAAARDQRSKSAVAYPSRLHRLRAGPPGGHRASDQPHHLALLNLRAPSIVAARAGARCCCARAACRCCSQVPVTTACACNTTTPSLTHALPARSQLLSRAVSRTVTTRTPAFSCRRRTRRRLAAAGRSTPGPTPGCAGCSWPGTP